MSDHEYCCDADDPDFFTEYHMERYFSDDDEQPKENSQNTKSKNNDEDAHQ